MGRLADSSAELPLGELSDVSAVELPAVQLPNGAPK
jgi:hypothetical protein